MGSRQGLARKKTVKLERGTVALVTLDPTRGREQRGTRPCVIVSDADVIADQRFPLVAVIPISTKAGEGALYPPLSPGASGLRKSSFALVDQVRSVDKRRIERVFGRISSGEIAAIDEGLLLFLGLG
jgi:mRNA interferase MazF